MNDQELQKAFMAFLIEDAAAQGMQIKSEQDLQAYAQQLGEEGLKAKYQEFMQKMQGGVKAALGAKLNYIRKIKGLCPEGEELVYMKQGGRVCPVCQKKRQEKVEMNQKGNAITKFKDSRKEDKYDVNEHNNLIKKYRNKTISKEELDRLHNLNKHPNATHEESDWATERPKPKSITNKKKLVDKNACGSKVKKHQWGGIAYSPGSTSDPSYVNPKYKNAGTSTDPNDNTLGEVVVTAKPKNNLGNGIYAWMVQNGLGGQASYRERKKLAKQFGIENYVGSAAQNNALQKILEHQLKLHILNPN